MCLSAIKLSVSHIDSISCSWYRCLKVMASAEKTYKRGGGQSEKSSLSSKVVKSMQPEFYLAFNDANETWSALRIIHKTLGSVPHFASCCRQLLG